MADPQYADGVMMATDTLASYGTLAMFKVQAFVPDCTALFVAAPQRAPALPRMWSGLPRLERRRWSPRAASTVTSSRYSASSTT